MDNTVSYIYKITNIINGKIYIGQSIDPIRRINQHIKYTGSSSYLLNHAIKKYGIENFLFEVIKSEVSIEQINETEIQCIKEHNCKAPNGYNLTDGGEGIINPSDEIRKKLSAIHKGKIVSEETRKKMSLAKKNNNANKGKKLSQETRNKIGFGNKGKTVSEETRKKLSIAGANISEKTREKLRLARIGKKLSEETKKKISESRKCKKIPVY